MHTDFLQTERALVDHSAPLLEQRFRPRHGLWRAAREVGAGRSIADLVFLIGPGKPPYSGAALTSSESVVLASLRRVGATRIDILERRCGLNSSELRTGALTRLLDWGLVLRGRGGRVEACKDWNDKVQIVAIEAKLTRWRKALEQAAQYRRYADYSYVLLPEANSRPALRQRSAFEALGIGVLVASQKSVELVLESTPQNDHDWRREFVYSRLILPQVQ